MQWRDCLEPKALCLLAYMCLVYLYTLIGHVEIAVVYALIAAAHLEHLKSK